MVSDIPESEEKSMLKVRIQQDIIQTKYTFRNRANFHNTPMRYHRMHASQSTALPSQSSALPSPTNLWSSTAAIYRVKF